MFKIKCAIGIAAHGRPVIFGAFSSPAEPEVAADRLAALVGLGGVGREEGRGQAVILYIELY